MLKSIRIQNMLSFPDSELELKPLNVLIGPNASGKSNLLEIVALLQAAPRGLADFVRRGGGVDDLLWKGATLHGVSRDSGVVNVILDNPSGPMPLRYVIELASTTDQMAILEERLENELPHPDHDQPYFYFEVRRGSGRISIPAGHQQAVTEDRVLRPDNLDSTDSVLHQRRDPEQYPVVTRVAREFDAIRLYREWNLGRRSEMRRPQPTDDPNDFLDESFNNLALVLNQLQLGSAMATIEDRLRAFYEVYDGVQTSIQANTVQLRIREKGMASAIPATRLSDGTLRFLSLLAILCHPEPPGLICIEEPELGLHPDIIPQVAELLKEASIRTQLIVTTHSERLVDELSDTPESVVVCERGPDFGTQFKRLSSKDLEVWLKEYQLGELWRKGELGGVRW